VASAMRARTMSPTLQETRAQGNAALARSSSTGHVVNGRYWHKADTHTQGPVPELTYSPPGVLVYLSLS